MQDILGGSSFSNRKVRGPENPNLRPGGFDKGAQGEAADYSIRQDIHNRDGASTPPHLKKYRKSHVNQPGSIQIHHGLADDPKRYADNYVYGKKSHPSEHVNDLMKAQNMTGMADKFNDIQEG